MLRELQRENGLARTSLKNIGFYDIRCIKTDDNKLIGIEMKYPDENPITMRMFFTNEKGVRYLTGVSVNKGVYFLERITNNKIEYVIVEDKDGNIV